MVRAFFVMLLLLPAAVCADGQDLLLEADLLPSQLYVQAQGVYRLRFYQGVDVRQIRFSAPSARLADIRPIGQDRVFESQRAGRRYRVHERSYAVIPFASGTLQLAGAQVTGHLPGQRAMRLQAGVQTLTVLPAPAMEGAWLAARELSLSERWSSTPDAVHQGMALRRSVRVEAIGVDAAQIPEILLATPGVMVHAEPARLENRNSGQFIVGIREQEFSLVPLATGPLTLPELRLAWWNVVKDTPAVAILPARILQVAAASPAMHSVAVSGRPVARAAVSASWQPYAVLATLFLALLWRSRDRLRSWWRLRRASHAGDVGVTRDALLAWVSCYWPETPPMTLAALADRLQDQEARQALAEMERTLYGRDPGQDCAEWLPVAIHRVRCSIKAAGKRARWHNGWVRKQDPAA